ncbi:MAG: FKBP-type peptidyl-prolyl cis-trans isomerase [Oryzihumus sp.]
MRLNRHKLVAAAAVPLLLLVGACGSSNKPVDAEAKVLDSVTVAGDAKAPTLTLKTKPLTVKKTVTKVVRPGTGPSVTKDEALTTNYLLVNGKDGKQLDSSFGKAPARMDLSSGKLLTGLSKGLLGQKVGSRVLVAIPPADGFATNGNPQIGIGANDTMLFLVDITAAGKPLTRATGTAVAPKAGLPTVVMGKDNHEAAKITVPKSAPPKTTVVQPLIQGKGNVIKAGQLVRFSYTGVIYRNGEMFDSSARTKEGYAEFPIGVGQLIPAWDKHIVGQRVGSRLLMVIPPADGYGAKGQPSAGIKGTDTLVFVIDLLDAS